MCGDGTGDILARAAELRVRGVMENNAGRPLRALRLLRRANALLEAVPDLAGPEATRLKLRVAISVAMSQSELQGLDAGLAVLRDIEAYVRETLDPEIAVHLNCQRGYMLVRGGRMLEGLDSLDAAVELIEWTQPGEACNILINRGVVQVLMRRLKGARSDYLRALALAEQHHLTVELVKARHNLGELEFFAGNLAVALRLMDEAGEIDAEVSAAVALLDRSRVLIEAGLHREAEETLVQAERMFRADRLWKDVGEVELARAECALLDGEFQAARRLAGNARTRFKRRGNDRWRRMAELVLLQSDLEAGRPGLRLAPHALRLANEFAVEGVPVQARTARLLAAECFLRAGRIELAEAAATEVDDIRKDDPISARLHARLVRAKLAQAAGDRTTSRKEIRTGLAELSRYQAQFGGIDLQTASAVHGRKLAELNLDLALESRKPSHVLAAVEEGRAISSRLSSVSAPEDETAAELLAELRQVSEELRTVESDPGSVSHVSQLRRRIRDIQKSLRERSWQFEGAREARRPATATAIGAELSRQRSDLVCYFESEGQMHAVIWGDGIGRIATLGAADHVIEQIKRIRADLDVMANGLMPGAMLQAVSASLQRSLNRLDDALIRPLDLPDDRMVLVPTGMLATVPWTILPSLSGRPVVVAPSATAWLDATTAVRTDGGDVLAIAGPDLKRAEEEVRAVGGHWGAARVVHGAKATREQLTQGITSARIVHVAAHGEHQMDNPLFSSIRLIDAPLYAWELDQHAAAAEHVILSACELGQATIRPGDEALGLTSVLLHLGTRSVISGVTRVHDDVAAEVMTRYHRDLANGLDSAQALADACSAQKDLPAPFVCFGSAWRAH